MSPDPDSFTLESARLVVRPLRPGDLDAVHAILNDSFGEEPLERRREWLEWSVRNTTALARLYQPPYGDRAVTLKPSGEVIGLVGLVPLIGPFDTLPYFRERSAVPPTGRFTAEMGLFWAVGAAHRGQGFATEAARALIGYAFEVLGMARLVATTADDNLRSRAVMERLGMRIEHNPLPTPEWFQVVGILDNPAGPKGEWR